MLKKILKQFFFKSQINNGMWKGNFDSWEKAVSLTSSYSKPLILEKVLESILKVKNGEAIYERDSVLFEKPEYPWPLLFTLSQIINVEAKEVNVIDFGGSLGSTYFQCKSIFKNDFKFKWNIIEQENFVTSGKRYLEDKELKFYYSLDDCEIKDFGHSVLLLSGVLQCLPTPFEILSNLIDKSFKHLIIDRTAFIVGDNMRLTIQTVPPSIYEASYPSWFLIEDSLIKFLDQRGYRLMYDFPSFADPDTLLEDGVKVYWKGFYFQRS